MLEREAPSHRRTRNLSTSLKQAACSSCDTLSGHRGRLPIQSCIVKDLSAIYYMFIAMQWRPHTRTKVFVYVILSSEDVLSERGVRVYLV